MPSWATPQKAIDEIDLPIGFLRDFLDYVNLCTDASSAFALGTGLGILATACGKCDLVVLDENGLDNTMPIRLWQALVGNSGQRKSKVLDLGIGLLRHTGYDILLPDDASVEAWHDTVVDQPVSLLYQEELSGLFEAQQRSYSTGLQSWLLKLWGGTPKERKTKSGGSKRIERPRLNILGAIPPDVFFGKTGSLDWRSGFLPRFLYWGGVREEWSPYVCSAPRQEMALAELLRCVHFKSDGEIVIPSESTKLLSDWFYTEVEQQSTDLLEDTYAGLLRLQEAGYVVAALVAMSRATKIVRLGPGRRFVVELSDMKTAIQILNLCKLTIESISGRANQDAISRSEESIVYYLTRQSEAVTVREITKSLRLSYKECRQHLLNLVACQVVTSEVVKTGTRGRPSTVFKIS